MPLELFCPTCKRFQKCESGKINRHSFECLSCKTEYSLTNSNHALFGMTPTEILKGIDMAQQRRKSLDTKVTTICCSVRIKYKQAILAYVSIEKEGSLAYVIGKVIEKWVDDNNLLKLIPSEIPPAIQDELEFKEDETR